jgi:t-SNARE complex subunit (syntaxin)
MILIATSLAQDTYIQSRSTAIESIESTIAELGQIFTQLATMVAEQRETVQRIDADTVDIASNVSGAQRELLKYYASISSNRWLMLKVFGVLIVFVSVLLYCGGVGTAEIAFGPVSSLYPRFVVCTLPIEQLLLSHSFSSSVPGL